MNNIGSVLNVHTFVLLVNTSLKLSRLLKSNTLISEKPISVIWPQIDEDACQKSTFSLVAGRQKPCFGNLAKFHRLQFLKEIPLNSTHFTKSQRQRQKKNYQMPFSLVLFLHMTNGHKWVIVDLHQPHPVLSVWGPRHHPLYMHQRTPPSAHAVNKYSALWRAWVEKWGLKFFKTVLSRVIRLNHAHCRCWKSLFLFSFASRYLHLLPNFLLQLKNQSVTTLISSIA